MLATSCVHKEYLVIGDITETFISFHISCVVQTDVNVQLPWYMSVALAWCWSQLIRHFFQYGTFWYSSRIFFRRQRSSSLVKCLTFSTPYPTAGQAALPAVVFQRITFFPFEAKNTLEQPDNVPFYLRRTSFGMCQSNIRCSFDSTQSANL